MGTSPQFVLGVDLDGVVGDYETGIRHAVSRATGVPEHEIGPQTAWRFSESNWPVRDDAHFREIHAGAVEEHLFLDLPLVEGASEGLWALSDAGVHIRIITHRLIGNFNHARAITDTVAWLDREVDGVARRKVIPYRDLCFVADKASVGCDAYVDDAPHNLAALRESGAFAICFDQVYNRMMTGPRARSWDELVSMVLARRDALLST